MAQLRDARTLAAARRRRVRCRLETTAMLAAIRRERGGDLAAVADRAAANIREFAHALGDAIEDEATDQLIANMWRNA